MSDNKWQIQPVCKTCHYRRVIEKTANINLRTYWEHTACHYFIDTDKLRDGNPQGDYCPNYKPKGRSEKQNE